LPARTQSCPTPSAWTSAAACARYKIDLSEAPQAYKNIDRVIDAQKDLVEVLVKLKPLGVVKG